MSGTSYNFAAEIKSPIMLQELLIHTMLVMFTMFALAIIAYCIRKIKSQSK